MQIPKLLLFALLLPVKLLGQVDCLDYGFINAALNQVYKYDTTFFFLQNKTFPCHLDNEMFEYSSKVLKKKISPEKIKELIRNSRLHKKGKLQFDVDSIALNTGAVLITLNAADSIQRARDSSLPLNKRLFYICSLPVFDSQKKFAVIDFGGGTARLAMFGKKYLFKNEKTGWVLIATFGDWAS